jgi:hypothetical protein
MLNKVMKWWSNGCSELCDYADTVIEYFITVWFVIFWFISRIFLIVTCPLWIIPYSIYKSRKGGVE